ncbi:hypothetical protein H4219_002886 [Mycoemilia scoparia]|uniref:Nudix hydrolase domain-containing protein n=1 Tax=Mycoemilia scoparia TaxID=417184 RepID=A0A9W8DNK3_9FUNG|nr:hypothetical protein H4219_002886 [Mycoemilia scoparia]
MAGSCQQKPGQQFGSTLYKGKEVDEAFISPTAARILGGHKSGLSCARSHPGLEKLGTKQPGVVYFATKFPMKNHNKDADSIFLERSNTRVPLKFDPSFTPPKDISLEQIIGLNPFKDWCNDLDRELESQRRRHSQIKSATAKNDIDIDIDVNDDADIVQINGITITSLVLFRNNKLGFVNLNVDGKWKKSQVSIPGSVFMRGGSVAVLLIVRPKGIEKSGYIPSYEDDDGYAVLTVQPRIPIARLSMAELPAGMLDDNSKFEGKAAAEIQEETGITIQQSDMVDLTGLMESHNQSGQPTATTLKARGLYPSAGGCDEFVRLFASVKEMDAEQIERLSGKTGLGVAEEGEQISLQLVPMKQLWCSSSDVKTLAALQLHDQLIRCGLL